MHRYVGPDQSSYLCPRKMLNKRCPICEAYKEAKDAQDEDEAKALRLHDCVVYWLLDRDSENPTDPILWLVTRGMDSDITTLTIDKKRGDVLPVDHHEEGYDLAFRREGQGINTKYKWVGFDREPSPISDDDGELDEVMDFINDNPLPDVMHYYDANYLEDMINGTAPERDEVDDDDEPPAKSMRRDKGERPAKPSRRDERDTGRSRVRATEPEDEDEDAEAEVEETKPRRSDERRRPERSRDNGEERRAKRRGEEEDEAEAKPVRSSRRAAVEDDEPADDERSSRRLARERNGATKRPAEPALRRTERVSRNSGRGSYRD
jgi:hypothetical protein